LSYIFPITIMNDYKFVEMVYDDGGPCMDCEHKYVEEETYPYGEGTVSQKFRGCMVLDTGFGICETAQKWKEEDDGEDI